MLRVGKLISLQVNQKLLTLNVSCARNALVGSVDVSSILEPINILLLSRYLLMLTSVAPFCRRRFSVRLLAPPQRINGGWSHIRKH